MEKEKVYTVADARSHLTDVLSQAAYGKERVMITRRNKPFAYVVSIEDMELLEELEDIYDIKASKEALKEAQEQGFIAWDDLKKELNI